MVALVGPALLGCSSCLLYQVVQAAAHACEGEPRASWCVKGLTGFEKEAQVYSVSLGSQGLLSSLFAIVRWLKLAAKCCQVI